MNFHLLMYLSLMMLPFSIWSFCIKFCYTRHSTRESIAYVECLPASDPPKVGRALSKLNLHTVIMENDRNRKQQELFDYFWYERRTQIKLKSRTDKESQIRVEEVAR